MELKDFAEKWDSRYPSIAISWTSRGENVITLFSQPHDTREIIYTMNAIDSLNSVIRKAIKTDVSSQMIRRHLKLCFWLVRKLLRNGPCLFETGSQQ